jgi:hypothetical protein
MLSPSYPFEMEEFHIHLVFPSMYNWKFGFDEKRHNEQQCDFLNTVRITRRLMSMA